MAIEIVKLIGGSSLYGTSEISLHLVFIGSKRGRE
jgi:hypothetical protein